MHWFFAELKIIWLWMLEPPWGHVRPIAVRESHWGIWFMGWSWALAGLVLGALVAPTLVQFTGLAKISYQDWFVITVAVVAGFLVQLLGWLLMAAYTRLTPQGLPNNPELLQHWLLGFTALILVLMPFASVGYAIYRYLSSVGANQRSVAVAFAGGLLVKSLIIPAIVGAIRSKAFKVFIDWLRGDKATTKSA